MLNILLTAEGSAAHLISIMSRTQSSMFLCPGLSVGTLPNLHASVWVLQQVPAISWSSHLLEKQTSNCLHAVSVYSLTHSHHELFFIVSGIFTFLHQSIFYRMLGKGKIQTCHFTDHNIGLFVLVGEERGKENNKCEDQNILNSLGGNTVSISSQRAVLTLP